MLAREAKELSRMALGLMVTVGCVALNHFDLFDLLRVKFTLRDSRRTLRQNVTKTSGVFSLFPVVCLKKHKLRDRRAIVLFSQKGLFRTGKFGAMAT